MKILKVILIGLIVISCSKNKKLQEVGKVEISSILSDSIFNATGAYISTDDKGDIILNWSESVDTLNTRILKFKTFDSANNTFSETITVEPSRGMQAHDESMAKVARSKTGVLYAVFRITTKNPKVRFGGHIYYSMSEDQGKTWSEKVKLVLEEGVKSQSFYDIAILSDGELGMCWLDSRKVEKDADGSSLYFAKTNKNKGFVEMKPIAGSTCQCCRTDIFVSNDNHIQVAFRNITEGSIRDMHIATSKDNGLTFTKPNVMSNDKWKIDGCPHTGPSLANSNEELGVAWFTGAESGAGIFFKKLENNDLFHETKSLVSYTGRHPQTLALPNGSFYVIYEDFKNIYGVSSSDILLQTIKKDNNVFKEVVSSDNVSNHHAVLCSLKDKSILVAWTRTEGNKSQIEYKIITI